MICPHCVAMGAILMLPLGIRIMGYLGISFRKKCDSHKNCGCHEVKL